MENEQLNVLRQVVEEGFGNADLYIIDQMISDDYLEHQFGMKGGKEGLKKAILSLAGAFSNRNYELMHYSLHDDIVWTHYKATGTHSSSFMGHEATGKHYSIDVIDVARIKNGQITEHWGVPDRFALLSQLGFLQPTSNIKL